MSFLQFVTSRGPERRTALAAGDAWAINLLGRGSQTASGTWVTPETVLRIAAVYRCIGIIGGHLAMLPLEWYRNGRRAKEAPLSILLQQPNPWQSGFEWRQMVMSHVLLYGNAYCEIFADGSGAISDLVPLNPARTRPIRRDDGSIWYEFRPMLGTSRMIAADDMFHLRGLTTDGIIGLSPIALAREAFGLAMAGEEYQARYFSGGLGDRIVLRHPKALSDEASERLSESVQQAYSGVANAHRPMVLEEGLDVSSIGINNRDAQFLELRKYQRNEIATLFGVPPHMIGDLERATFSNIEQQSLEYIRDCLGPWAANFEDAIRVRLMTAKARSLYEVRFRFDDLLRGDMAARSVFYHEAILDGWMNRAEPREREGLDPAPASAKLDRFLVPLNEGPSDKVDEPPPEPAPKPALPPPADKQRLLLEAMRGQLGKASRAAADRLVRKEVTAVRRIAKKHHPRQAMREFVGAVEDFYKDFEGGAEHASASKRAIRDAIATGAPDDGIDAVEALMAQWEASRAAELTAKEMQQWS